MSHTVVVHSDEEVQQASAETDIVTCGCPGPGDPAAAGADVAGGQPRRPRRREAR